MKTSVLLTAIATVAVAASSHAQISNYIVVNQIANGGFENYMSSWSTNESFIDPHWYGDPAQYAPLFGEGVTNYTKRTGARGYQFGMDYNQGEAYVYSEVHQYLNTPMNASAAVSAQFYAWSPASSWSPQTVTVRVDYSDATPSYYNQDITGSYYGPQPGDWQLVNFKSSLKAGKTITRLTISTESFPYNHTNLWIDDVVLSKKVPLIIIYNK